jgi:hypothetical protein
MERENLFGSASLSKAKHHENTIENISDAKPLTGNPDNYCIVAKSANYIGGSIPLIAGK